MLNVNSRKNVSDIRRQNNRDQHARGSPVPLFLSQDLAQNSFRSAFLNGHNLGPCSQTVRQCSRHINSFKTVSAIRIAVYAGDRLARRAATDCSSGAFHFVQDIPSGGFSSHLRLPRLPPKPYAAWPVSFNLGRLASRFRMHSCSW